MSTGDRFRFEMLQSRFQRSWISGTAAYGRARKGGPGRSPSRRQGGAQGRRAGGREVVSVTAFRDPLREMDKLHALYDSLMDARREPGDDVVPFHRFASLVKTR